MSFNSDEDSSEISAKKQQDEVRETVYSGVQFGLDQTYGPAVDSALGGLSEELGGTLTGVAKGILTAPLHALHLAGNISAAEADGSTQPVVDGAVQTAKEIGTRKAVEHTAAFIPVFGPVVEVMELVADAANVIKHGANQVAERLEQAVHSDNAVAENALLVTGANICRFPAAVSDARDKIHDQGFATGQSVVSSLVEALKVHPEVYEAEREAFYMAASDAHSTSSAIPLAEVDAPVTAPAIAKPNAPESARPVRALRSVPKLPTAEARAEAIRNITKSDKKLEVASPDLFPKARYEVKPRDVDFMRSPPPVTKPRSPLDGVSMTLVGTGGAFAATVTLSGPAAPIVAGTLVVAGGVTELVQFIINKNQHPYREVHNLHPLEIEIAIQKAEAENRIVFSSAQKQAFAGIINELYKINQEVRNAEERLIRRDARFKFSDSGTGEAKDLLAHYKAKQEEYITACAQFVGAPYEGGRGTPTAYYTTLGDVQKQFPYLSAKQVHEYLDARWEMGNRPIPDAKYVKAQLKASGLTMLNADLERHQVVLSDPLVPEDIRRRAIEILGQCHHQEPHQDVEKLMKIRKKFDQYLQFYAEMEKAAPMLNHPAVSKAERERAVYCMQMIHNLGPKGKNTRDKYRRTRLQEHSTLMQSIETRIKIDAAAAAKKDPLAVASLVREDTSPEVRPEAPVATAETKNLTTPAEASEPEGLIETVQSKAPLAEPDESELDEESPVAKEKEVAEKVAAELANAEQAKAEQIKRQEYLEQQRQLAMIAQTRGEWDAEIASIAGSKAALLFQQTFLASGSSVRAQPSLVGFNACSAHYPSYASTALETSSSHHPRHRALAFAADLGDGDMGVSMARIDADNIDEVQGAIDASQAGWEPR